jgi:hypothetical protein
MIFKKKNYYLWTILFGIVFQVSFVNSTHACNSGNTGVTYPGYTLVSSSTVCVGNPIEVNYTHGGTCATGGCDIERMIIVRNSSGQQISSTGWQTGTTTFYVTINSTGTYYILGCTRASGFGVPCETNQNQVTAVSAPSGPSSASGSTGCMNMPLTVSSYAGSGLTTHWFSGPSITSTFLGSGNTYTETHYSSGTYTYYAFFYNSSTQCYSNSYASATMTVYNSLPPDASITGPGSGGTGSTYTFSAPSGASSYSWSVSGSGTIVGGGGSSDDYVEVTWSSSGYKSVNVTVQDNTYGCTASDTRWINIIACPSAEINSVSDNCVGSTNSISAVSQISGTSYSWNFGSGASPSSGSGVGTHSVSYSSAGVKTVTLTVSKSGCASLQDTESFEIFANPTANISGTTTGSLNTSYSFSTPAVSGATYAWTDNGGSGSSTTNSLNTSWSTSGTKTVCVTVETGGGTCSDNNCHNIAISASCPNAEFDPPSGCTGQTVAFAGEDQGSGVTYSWNFGSGASPSSASGLGPHNVTYSTSGTKSVSLTVSKSGCSNDVLTENVTINATPTANISGATTTTVNTQETFTTPSVSGATYTWQYTSTGSGSSSTNSIDITWTNTGSKTVEVTVAKSGCEDTDSHVITVSNGPCYGSSSRYEDLSLNTNMDGQTITDGAGTSVDYKIYDPNGVVTDFKTDQTFSRNSDTSILWEQNWGSFSTASITFNTSVNNLTFCVRGLTEEGNSSGSNFAFDGIQMDPYSGGSTITLTSGDYSTGGKVVWNGSNQFYSTDQGNNSSTDHDVCFDLSDYAVDSVRIAYGYFKYTSGSGTQKIGVSNLDWCTNTPLPVSWGGILAVQHDYGNRIEWQTLQEVNCEYFEVERSYDANHFEAVSEIIPAAGNSQVAQNYFWVDASSASNQTVYYRVKQVDFDGQYDYSEMVAVKTDGDYNPIVVYPQPAKDQISVTYSGNQPIESIKVYDMFGTLVDEINRPNNGITSIPTAALRNGNYWIQCSSADEVWVKRFIVAR